MKRNLRKIRGLTIIELVIYIGLLASALAFVMLTFFQIVSSQDQNRRWIEVESEAGFALKKIEWVLRGAQIINQPTVNATSTTLSVNMFGSAQNPFVFAVSSGTLTLSRGGGVAVSLTDGRVSVSGLLFRGFPAQSGGTEAVSIGFTVKSNIQDSVIQASTTLSETVYLRL